MQDVGLRKHGIGEVAQHLLAQVERMTIGLASSIEGMVTGTICAPSERSTAPPRRRVQQQRF